LGGGEGAADRWRARGGSGAGHWGEGKKRREGGVGRGGERRGEPAAIRVWRAREKVAGTMWDCGEVCGRRCGLHRENRTVGL
jgi:hypothetical protein